MKSFRSNKVLGLAIGERSLLAAEVVGGDRPEVTRVGEFVYPVDVSIQQPAALGKALAEFLSGNGFTAKTAVVGLPAKWLIVKPREVPPADAATRADVLRLQSEGEFSSELKDLVCDYVGGDDSQKAATVLLVAAQRKVVDAVVEMCESAGLDAAAVLPSAVALGAAMDGEKSNDSFVLAVGQGGAELTAQSGGTSLAIRYLRGSSAEKIFVGELRRAVLAMPVSESAREMVLWDDGGLNPRVLGENLGMAVRHADLSAMGIHSTGAAANGHGSKFAPAVALALAVLGERVPAIDFLHSRLAAPRKKLIPRWAMFVAAAVLALVVGGIYGYVDLRQQQDDLAVLKNRLAGMQSELKTADAFVSKVSFAQGWHSGDARYLACLRDMTAAFPEDGQSYATNLIVRELPRTIVNGKPVETGMLAGQLYGKTSDQQRVQIVLDRLKHVPAFADVKLGGTQDVGRGREVSFSITFTYRPAKQPM